MIDLGRSGALIAAAALLAPFGNVSAATQPSAMPAGPITVAERFSLQSRILGEEREINIWVPPPANMAFAAPKAIVYLLDGGRDQDFLHIAGLANLASLSGTFGPFILVGVKTDVRLAELTPRPVDKRYREAFPEAGGAERFRQFLEQELIPFVEARYPAPMRRALVGESLAGLFVVDTLLSRPSLFQDYVAISPSLWWDDRLLARSAADRLALDVPDRRLFLTIANEGGTMQDGMDRLVRALTSSGQKQIRWTYSDRSRTATHSTILHSAAEEALRWLFPSPPFPHQPPPWFMVEGAEPPKKESK